MSISRKINDSVCLLVEELKAKSYAEIFSYNDYPIDLGNDYIGHRVFFKKMEASDGSILVTVTHEDSNKIELPEFLRKLHGEVRQDGASLFTYGFYIFPDGKIIPLDSDGYDD